MTTLQNRKKLQDVAIRAAEYRAALYESKFTGAFTPKKLKIDPKTTE